MDLKGRSRSLFHRVIYDIVLRFDDPISVREGASGPTAGLRGLESIFRMFRPLVLAAVLLTHLALPGLVYAFGVRGAHNADALAFSPPVDGGLLSAKSVFLLLFAVVLAVVVHELAHAVLLLGNGVRIRGIGIQMFAFVPTGAGIKFSTDEWGALPTRVKVTILSAGISANLVLSLGAFLALRQYPSPFLFWLATTNFALGVWNCLPLGGQDGGKLFFHVLSDKIVPAANQIDRSGIRTAHLISQLIIILSLAALVLLLFV